MLGYSISCFLTTYSQRVKGRQALVHLQFETLVMPAKYFPSSVLYSERCNMFTFCIRDHIKTLPTSIYHT